MFGALALGLFATLPSQAADAGISEFCVRLDELGAQTEAPRIPEPGVQAFVPAKGTSARDWPRIHGWVAWGFDADMPHGTRLRIGLRELRENAFHAHGESVSAGPQRFVALLPVGKWDRFVLISERAGKWSVARDEAIAKEPKFSGFDERWIPALGEGGWARSVALFASGSIQPTGSCMCVHSANGPGTADLALALDYERQGDMVTGMAIGEHEPWFDHHPLEQWPQPVWALSAELRSPWPLPTPEAPDSNVWELADRLEGWKLPADTLEADKLVAQGLRAPEDPAARSWPRERGWLACGLRLRAQDGRATHLALWDVRKRQSLLPRNLESATTLSAVFLLRVPELDRCCLLRREGAHWIVDTGREVPEAARAGGFGALALPELEHGGWIESCVRSVRVEERTRVRPRIENLWFWSGNGKGTLELAEEKDGTQRGIGLGSSVTGEKPDFDPWFLQNPMQDWPWPVWALRVEIAPKQ